MERIKELEMAGKFRTIARYTSLVVGISLFIFAFFSGYDEFGVGISGMINNIPNLLPWALLLVAIFIAWHWELLGGIIITLLGITLLYYFNLTKQIFFSISTILSLLVIILGAFFILSWYFEKVKE